MGYETYDYMKKKVWHKLDCLISFKIKKVVSFTFIVIVWIINYFENNKISTTQLFTFEMPN